MLQSVGSQRIGHNLATEQQQMFIFFSPLIPFIFSCKLSNLKSCYSELRNILLYMFINILHNCCSSYLIPDLKKKLQNALNFHLEIISVSRAVITLVTEPTPLLFKRT